MSIKVARAFTLQLDPKPVAEKDKGKQHEAPAPGLRLVFPEAGEYDLPPEAADAAEHWFLKGNLVDAKPSVATEIVLHPKPPAPEKDTKAAAPAHGAAHPPAQHAPAR